MGYKINQDSVDLIIKLRTEGLSYHKIAKTTGFSSRRIYEICNPEKVRSGKNHTDQMQRCYLNKKEEYLTKQKLYRVKNKDKLSSGKKEYYKENKEHLLNYYKEWRSLNVHKQNEYSARKRYLKKKSKFLLNKEFSKEIINFYKEAKRLTLETGIQYHVDHIVPLQGEHVSGLHVPWNLQILTAKENIEKRNKHTMQSRS